MKRPMLVCLGLALLVAVAPGMTRFAGVWMGRQPDGSFLVSTGQRIEAGSIAFTGRPIDMALHPTKDLFAILNKDSVLLATAEGVIRGTEVALGASAGFRGLVWTPDGEWLAASTERGHIQLFRLSGTRLLTGSKITITPKGQSANPVPGGMAISRDGSRLFVAAANRNAVVLVDLARKVPVGETPARGRRASPTERQDPPEFSSAPRSGFPGSCRKIPSGRAAVRPRRPP